MSHSSATADPFVSLITTVDAAGCIEPRDAGFWRRAGAAERIAGLTRNRAVIMGRLTFSALSFLHPDRFSFVLTRDPDLLEEGGARFLTGYGYWFMPGLAEALVAARHVSKRVAAPELFVVGGAGVLAEALPSAQRIYRTIAHGRPAGATRLEGLGAPGWRTLHAERPTRSNDGSEHVFEVIERAGRQRDV